MTILELFKMALKCADGNGQLNKIDDFSFEEVGDCECSDDWWFYTHPHLDGMIKWMLKQG